ncbi:MAG: DUF2520 domain-containing protein [Chloroflexi bacterium]|nr:DUF2520 domain-containing protein [Chloroflexota bacterium]
MDDDRLATDQGPSRTGRPRLGIVGAGRVGAALGVAVDRAGWPVVAVASRDAARRARLQSLVPGVVGVSAPADLVELVDLVFVTVPDDAIGDVAASVRLRPGQGIVHTSGALSAGVLAPAVVAGADAASFHPLVPFAELGRAIEALRGATIVLEGDPALVPTLTDLAMDLGARPIEITSAGKAAHHAASVLAGGGIVALLDAVAALGRGAGLDERHVLDTYGPLIRLALGNAEALGISTALTGPFVRGDARTVALHLDAIERLAPDVRALYVAAADRQISLAVSRGDLSDARAAALAEVLEPA